MDGDDHYRVVVVGAGMIGSAAAKYAALYNNQTPQTQRGTSKVCLIGPREPKDKRDATIHGAHYDEGRIARRAGKDPIWALLSTRTMDRLNQLEQLSGLSIYSEVGFMAVGTQGSDFMTNYKTVTERNDLKHVAFKCSEAIKGTFPYLDFGADTEGLYTEQDSGYINPRNMVEAQKVVAAQYGCDIIEDVVISVQRSENKTSYIIKTAQGRILTADKVLICTGAFTHFHNLLPSGVKPQVKHHPNSVILVEVDESEHNQLRNMPCISFKGGPWDRPGLNIVAYIMPPVKYPDGKFYLKLGHGCWEPKLLHTPDEITKWYLSGKQADVDVLLYQITRNIFPDLKMTTFKYDYCVTTNTPQGYPYVDLLSETLGVAIAGCGQAAKASDEIGRMAARMILNGKWDHDLPLRYFKFENESTPFSKL